MPDIVGIRFKRAGKVYYFEPSGVELKVSDYVVVQTARGIELGQVMIAPKQVLASEITAELKPIVRKASEEDTRRARDFGGRESNALDECSKMIVRLKLPMKLVAAEYNLDGGRLTFYFTAEERVDFRELVRELTAFFKTRIELRQIGPRDQAKIVGGLGRCGRSLCCGSFLTEFNPVSIKMAKEQDLPLDPMKISGVCGRLQCCLAYENTQYHEAKALLPKRGLQVKTPEGTGIVIGGNPLKETVLVEMESSKATAEFALNQVTIIIPPVGQPAPVAVSEVKDNEAPEAATQAKMNPPQAPLPVIQPEIAGEETVPVPESVPVSGTSQPAAPELAPAPVEPDKPAVIPAIVEELPAADEASSPSDMATPGVPEAVQMEEPPKDQLPQ